jgi:hypothetical protein
MNAVTQQEWRDRWTHYICRLEQEYNMLFRQLEAYDGEPADRLRIERQLEATRAELMSAQRLDFRR